MRKFKFLTVTALSLLSAPVLAQDLRDLTVEQATVAQAGSPRPGSLQVSVATDRQDATYAVGETVKLVLSATEDAYVTVLDVGPTGQVTQLFPNLYQTDNHVYANRPVEIAGPGSGARVTVSGPVGTELIKVVAASRPITVVPETQLQGRGVFRTVEGGAQTLARNLQVVADPAAQNDTRIALTNFTLRTIPSRVSAAPALVIVPGQAPAVQAAPIAATLLPVVVPIPAAAPISLPSHQPFPLLIAADRSSYRVGDKVTLAVTTMQACNLTVLEFTTSGQVRTLFPNPATPNNAIGGQQTVMIAGGPSAVAMPVVGPAGTEQVLAICSTDAVAVNAGGDRGSVLRDLAVVAERQGAVTAMAAVTFTVQM